MMVNKKMITYLSGAFLALLFLTGCPNGGIQPTAEYTITFDANGGTGEMSPQILAEANSAALNSNLFTRSGYAFAGWSLTPAGEKAYDNEATFTMDSADVTLYALWSQNIHSVTFNANGGTGTMTAQSIAESATAALNSNQFTRAGYLFAGWSLSTDGDQAYSNEASITMGSADIILYAIWSQNIHTITFDANGGTGAMTAQSVAEFGSAALSSNQFTRTGYTFSGWALTSNGTKAYDDAATMSMESADIILYALWTFSSYSISYHLDGGNNAGGNPDEYTIVSSEITLAPPSKTIYQFEGWFDNAFFTGDALTAITTGSTGDRELWAKWSLDLVGAVFTSDVYTHVDGIKYKKLNDSNIQVSGNYLTTGHVILLHSINGIEITTIAAEAFASNSSITSVIMPDTIEFIGDDAFYQNTSLTHIDLSDNLKTLGDSVFAGDTSLEAIELPSTLVSIGINGFMSCTALTEAVLPSSISVIPECLFYGCIRLNSVTALGAVTLIQPRAFAYVPLSCDIAVQGAAFPYTCSGVIYEDNGDGTIKITNGTGATSGDFDLGGGVTISTYEITLLSSVNGKPVTTIAQRDLTGTGVMGGAFMMGNSMFATTTHKLTSIRLPDSLTTISANTFRYCSNLTEVEIPESITHLYGGVFSRCARLNTVKIHGALTNIEGGCFEMVHSDQDVIGDGLGDNSITVYFYGTDAAPAVNSTSFDAFRGDKIIHIPAGASGFDVYPWVEDLNYNPSLGYDLHFDL